MAMRLVSGPPSLCRCRAWVASLKSGKSDNLLALPGAMIFLLIWSPMSGLPLSATMSLKRRPGDDDGSERNAGIFVADIFDEQQDEDMALY